MSELGGLVLILTIGIWCGSPATKNIGAYDRSIRGVHDVEVCRAHLFECVEGKKMSKYQCFKNEKLR